MPKRESRVILARWPVPRPRDWTDGVNQPQTEAEVAEIRRSIVRGVPFGDEAWTERAIAALGLETTVRPRGRPRKGS